MKRGSRRYSNLVLVTALLFCLGAENQCASTPPTVSGQLGQAAQKENDAKDAQISELKALVTTQAQKFDDAKKVVAKAGANVHGVIVAAVHVNDGLPKDAVVAEANLASDTLATVSPPDPEASLEAERRVNLILTNQRDAALKAYGAAQTEVSSLKTALAQKDAEIGQHQASIAARDQQLVQLAKDRQAEIAANAAKIQTVINGYESKIQQMKDEEAAKQRRMWLNVMRFGGFGIILVGIVVIALTRGEAIIQGGILILGGGLVIGIGLAFDIVTSQPWFPYVAAIVGLLILGGAAWGVYHLWQTNQLYQKTTAAMQDVKDEAASQGSDLWNKVREHLQYRLGPSDGYWGKVLHSRLVHRELDSNVAPPAPPPEPTNQIVNV